jgi:hypothetical protein
MSTCHRSTAGDLAARALQPAVIALLVARHCLPQEAVTFEGLYQLPMTFQ